jgi:LacI family transcriptional regulator
MVRRTGEATRTATIKDVAAQAGVGIGTVSRVLNDHPAVTDDTRARVRAAIATLDYHPNRAARALSRRRAGSIAVLVPFFTHASAIERLRGVVSVLDESGSEVVLFNVDHAAALEAKFTQLTRRDLADGALVLSLRPNADQARRLRDSRLPVVMVDADVPGFPAFVVDDVAGGRLAARHLLDLGHRRIAYLGDTVDPAFRFISSARRQQGLVAEMTKVGADLPPDRFGAGIHDSAVALGVAMRLLQSEPPPTAVFAHSDTQALAVLEAANRLGLRVPDEVSVIGYDDIELAGYAGLTTVRQPLFESGRLGAQRLLSLMQHGTYDGPKRVELPLEVVVRRTTGPVGAHRPQSRRSGAHGAHPTPATGRPARRASRPVRRGNTNS